MDASCRAKPFFRVAGAVFSLVFFVVLSGAIRCHNFSDIFLNGKVYFVDADCYSRMTRVRMVVEHPLTIIRHHDFENYPQGIAPHTTMPMDWLIAIADCGLRIAERILPQTWRAQHLDLAGALVSPLLGVATVIFVWAWSRRMRFGAAGVWIVAASPILVHGTLLGRPDHQSLLIFLVAVAMGAEVNLAREPSRAWGIASGAAWALALWVSLYEPLVLLATTLAAQLVFFRVKFFAPERRTGFVLFVTMLAFAALIERWHFQLPDATMREFFPAWKRTIGELQPVSIFSWTLYRWAGFGLIAAPLLLVARMRLARETVVLLALLVVSLGFTVNQQRWGYFLALIFAMSLPCALALFQKKWIVWLLFALSLWPIAREWEDTFFPNETRAAQIAERRSDDEQLRDVAERLAQAPRGGVLAPWWFCPPLAYWSAQPCVAGSSHESLSGIVDTARFYLASDPEPAEGIAEKRRVRWVVAYDSSRVIQSAATLFNLTPVGMPMARILDERPHSAPPFLKPRYANQAFKIFEVETKLQP